MFKAYFLLPIVALVAWCWPKLGATFFERLEKAVTRISMRPWLAVLSVGVISFVTCAGIGLSTRIPAPHTHDEFGYLLIADTLAEGRLSNPTHPHWQHFESVHIMQQPTYTSKYPPAQGAALALGELLVRAPILGVWISTALACAAMCWMLLAWVPARYAVFGGILSAFHPQMLVWSQTYWGGAMALLGGALVLGGFRRIVERPRVPAALWLGMGLVVLANSRPYEGFIFALMIGLLLGWQYLVQRSAPAREWLPKVALPLGIVSLLLAAQLGYYNYRVTGNALRMPYVVYESTYGMAPLFLFQQEKPEVFYRHREIQELQGDYLYYFRSQTASLGGLVKGTVEKVYLIAQAALWSLLFLVPLAATPWVWREHWIRTLWIISGIFLAAMLVCTWAAAHYAAPAAGVLAVLVLVPYRKLRGWQVGGRPLGLALSRWMLVLCALSSSVGMIRFLQAENGDWAARRQSFIRQLQATEGKHLVFVKYPAKHNPHREWVYNAADLDNAKVVFARLMSPEQNASLCQYFGDRKLWLAEANWDDPELRPVEKPSDLPLPNPTLPMRSTRSK